MMKLSKCPFTGGFKYGRFSFTAVSRSPLGYGLLIYNTDRSIDADFRIYNRSLVHGDTNIFIQKTYYRRHGIVDYHAAGVKESSGHINGSLGRGKSVRDLFGVSATGNDFDVIIGIDVYFLYTRFIDPLL